MSKGQKYVSLEQFLNQQSGETVVLTFGEIEKILGFQLTDSAYQYAAFWSNTLSHSIAFAWLNAGYQTQDVSLTEQRVIFQRKDHPRELPAKKWPCELPAKKQPCEKKGCSSLSEQRILQLIRDYFNKTQEDPHARYLSWRHCYNAFSNRKQAKSSDDLALQLAFYLASWGMYRGSSFLFQKDYKVHVPIVKLLLEARYDPLRGISARELCEDKSLALLDELSARIRQAYAQELPVSKSAPNHATDTLVTKILLGTLGCVPAYDRFFVQGVKRHHISNGVYSSVSVRAVAQFYCNHWDSLERLRGELSQCGTEYPAMKLMDMCFWQDSYIMQSQKNRCSTSD